MTSKTFKTVSNYILAAGFIFVGILHFVRPSGFVAIVPPFLPAHSAIVSVSGFFEVLGGVGMVITRFHRAAVIGLIALVVVVFPANIYMLLHPEQFAVGWITPLALWIRLPLQPILIWWLWVVRNNTRQEKQENARKWHNSEAKEKYQK